MRIHSKWRQHGFSLIELLVGIVLAMAAVIIVMQVFKASEGSRRTTAGGDDAQTTGAISLTVLQRDLRQAGQGLTNANLLNCDLLLAPGKTLNGVAPLTINHASVAAGDAGTDTLLIIYGSSNGSPEGDRIVTQPGAAIYAVSAAAAFSQGDFVIATPGARTLPCGLNLTQVAAAPALPNVSVVTGMAGVSNGTLYNWGSAPRIVAYAVRNGRLTSCDYLTQNCNSAAAANWAEISDGIVGLRAQYARDTTAPPDGRVDTYDQTTPATAPAWSCVMAMRLVIVARNGQLESDDVSGVAPTWAAGASAPIAFAGTAWKRYRYKTFETTVPLRNVAWQGVPTAC
jgi:type IV pilus assembly protein PilW